MGLGNDRAGWAACPSAPLKKVPMWMSLPPCPHVGSLESKRPQEFHLTVAGDQDSILCVGALFVK